MPYSLSGQRLTVGRPFTHPDGRQFSGGWSNYTTAELTALGIVYEDEPPSFDRFYYTGLGAARPLDDLKTILIQQQKDTAASLLSQTDWYVTRKADLGTAIPDAVNTARASVRSICVTREGQINAVSDVAALEALMKAPRSIENDAGEVVANPAALTQWPDALP